MLGAVARNGARVDEPTGIVPNPVFSESYSSLPDLGQSRDREDEDDQDEGLLSSKKEEKQKKRVRVVVDPEVSSSPCGTSEVRRAVWDSERIATDSHRPGYESEDNSSDNDGLGMRATLSMSSDAASLSSGPPTKSKSPSPSSSRSTGLGRGRNRKKKLGGSLETTLEEGSLSGSESRTGAPVERLSERGISLVVNTFKHLKQSVVEVIRISELTIQLGENAEETPTPDRVWAIVELFGRERRGCMFCRRKAAGGNVFGCFAVKLEKTDKNLLGTTQLRQDVRITRHCRVRGNLVMEVKLCLEAPEPEAVKKRKSFAHVGRFHLNVPAVFQQSATQLTADNEIQYRSRSSVRRSFTTLSTANGETRYAKKMSTAESQFCGSSCTGTITMMERNKVFDIADCKPKRNKLYSQWRPMSRKDWFLLWSSPWRDQCLMSQSKCLAAMCGEMKNEIVVFYQTLFCQGEKARPDYPKLSSEEFEAYVLKILFLKRLILCLAANRVTFCTEENGTARRPWPFPLVSALCHGGRILIRLDGVDWKAFINFLIFGDDARHDWGSDCGNVPSPFYKRIAATHAIGLHENGRLYERKLGATNVAKNIKDGLTSHHLGMDLPLGGLGNRGPNLGGSELYVGPSGTPFKKTKGSSGKFEWVNEVQHGHMYLRWDEFPTAMMPVIVEDQPHEAVTEDDLPTMDARMTSGADEEDDATWFHLPAFHSVEDLRNTLVEFGCSVGDSEEDEEAIAVLHKLLDKDGELLMQSNGEILRCRGVLIHLVFEYEEDGQTKVLLHEQATAVAGDVEAEADDLRVAMTLRRRGELVDDAVERMCRARLELGAAAADRVVEQCRLAMTGRGGRDGESSRKAGSSHSLGENSASPAAESTAVNEDMLIYKCKPARTLCHHHTRCCMALRLKVDYVAYRFTFHVRKADRPLFSKLLKPQFETTECVDTVSGFPGDYGEELNSSGAGKITRSWRWYEENHPHMVRPAGLVPPKQRMRVLQETGHLSALLIGIENSAPLKEDFFGGKHSAAAVSKESSAFGTRKWRSYRKGGQEVPADIGGMHVEINAQNFDLLKDMCRARPLRRPLRPGEDIEDVEDREDEKALFRRMLAGNDDNIQEVLEKFFQNGMIWPSQYQKAGTQLLDSSIRERAASSSRLVTPKNSLPARGRSPSATPQSSMRLHPMSSAGIGTGPKEGHLTGSSVSVGEKNHQSEASLLVQAALRRRLEFGASAAGNLGEASNPIVGDASNPIGSILSGGSKSENFMVNGTIQGEGLLRVEGTGSVVSGSLVGSVNSTEKYHNSLAELQRSEGEGFENAETARFGEDEDRLLEAAAELRSGGHGAAVPLRDDTTQCCCLFSRSTLFVSH